MSFEKEEHLFFRNFWFLYFQKLHFWKYMYLYKVGICRSKYTLSSTAHIPLYNIHYTVSPCLVQLCIVRNFFKSHYLFKSSPISRRAILTIFKWSQVLSTEIRFQFGFCCLLTFLNFFFPSGFSTISHLHILNWLSWRVLCVFFTHF